jgi:YidC/Oxa1 family membrane protein insertase
LTNFLSGIFIQFFNAMHGLVEAIISNPNLSYGITIILFTLVMRILLLPLSLKQTKSTVKMSAIQPEVKKIQEKYKKDPQKAQQEVMKIYKENDVSPMGGCLPMLVQFPILIAMFYVFQHIDYQGAGFLWLPSLTKPDPYYILPLISGITTYFSTKSMQGSSDAQAAKQASTMNIGMSIFFTFMSLKFLGALVLYWVVNNILQLLQNLAFKKDFQRSKSENNMI